MFARIRVLIEVVFVVFTLAQRRNCTFEMYDIVRTMNKLLMKDDVTCNCISFFGTAQY